MLPPPASHENRVPRRFSGDLLDRGYSIRRGYIELARTAMFAVMSKLAYVSFVVTLATTLTVSVSLHAEEPPPNLATRAVGIDWPDFLGPQRDSRSPETGILTDWAAQPPRVVWQCE